MEEKKEERKEKEVVVQTVYDPEYREFYVAEAWGGFKRPDIFDATFCDVVQEIEPENSKETRIRRVKKVRLIMSPETVKAVAEWLTNHYNNREQTKQVQTGSTDTSSYIR